MPQVSADNYNFTTSGPLFTKKTPSYQYRDSNSIKDSWIIMHQVSADNHNFTTSGPLFTKKTPSYEYRDSHYKPEMVVRLS